MKGRLSRILAIILPIVMLVIFSSPLNIAMGKIHDPFLKSVVAILGTVAVTLVLLFIMTLLQKKTGAPAIPMGGWKKNLYGLLAGAGISLSSGIFFSLAHGVPMNLQPITHVLLRFIVSIPSSVLEEIAFRGGVVHFVMAYFGDVWGLMAGSVPFGLLHLLNLFFGIPIDLSQMMGLFAAGLFLSLIYLRLGLIAAIEVHWIWNSLSGAWVEVLSLPSKTGQMIFEGAWTTVAVLLGFSLLFYFLPEYSSRPPALSARD